MGKRKKDNGDTIREQMTDAIDSDRYSDITRKAGISPSTIKGIKDGKTMKHTKFLSFAKYLGFKSINLDKMRLER